MGVKNRRAFVSSSLNSVSTVLSYLFISLLFFSVRWTQITHTLCGCSVGETITARRYLYTSVPTLQSGTAVENAHTRVSNSNAWKINLRVFDFLRDAKAKRKILHPYLRHVRGLCVKHDVYYIIRLLQHNNIVSISVYKIDNIYRYANSRIINRYLSVSIGNLYLIYSIECR